MTEENKKIFKMGSLIRMLIGFCVLFLGVGLSIKYFAFFMTVVVGCCGPFLILVGLIMIAAAKE